MRYFFSQGNGAPTPLHSNDCLKVENVANECIGMSHSYLFLYVVLETRKTAVPSFRWISVPSQLCAACYEDSKKDESDKDLN